MEEIAERQDQMPAVLDSYAAQGRMLLFSAAQNLIQFGRVLAEAKPLVARGKWEQWVQKNFNMSERTAQQYMAVWKRFGGDERLKTVQFSNLTKMLALPEGTEQEFATENDLEAMTARQVEQAVAKVRREAQAAIAEEQQARKRLEIQLEEAKTEQGPQDRALVTKFAETEAALRNRERELAKANREKAEAEEALRSARENLAEMEEALTENQREYNRLQNELLNTQSSIAKGDAERTISEQLTGEDFAAAVRLFLGSVAQMPYMGQTFAGISDMTEYRQWDQLLQAVEEWTEKARKALNTTMKGDIIDG